MDETGGSRFFLDYDNAWQDSLLRPAVIAALVGCILVAMISFIRHIGPGLPPAYIGILRVSSIGAALVGCYTTTVLVRPAHRSRRTLTFRLSEIGLILFAARLALWATVEGWPTPSSMILQPIGAFVTLGFVLNAVLILIAWGDGGSCDRRLSVNGLADGRAGRFGGCVEANQW